MSPAEQLADTIPPPPPPTMPAPQPVKICGCGRAYHLDEWRRLHRVGAQDDGDGGELELRDCAGCLSTIAIEIPNRQDRDAGLSSERATPASAVRLCPVGVL
jgi:hypothetical protein